jgi:hypothetical protein
MNEKIKRLALEAGGSTYPEVGGKNLERFAELLIQECIDAVSNTPTHCAKTSFQIGIVQCTINKSVEVLKNHFKQD